MVFFIIIIFLVGGGGGSDVWDKTETLAWPLLVHQFCNIFAYIRSSESLKKNG